MRRKRCARVKGNICGFTLIELLVSVAIIAILAALIFGSFAKIKESSLRTACAGNLKQVGIAASLYAGDNNGDYPYTNDLIIGVRKSGAPGLIDLLGEYVNKDYRVFYCTDVQHGLPAPDNLNDLTYAEQAKLPEASRFSIIGYNWLVSKSNQWPATPQKIIGSMKRILATCLTFGGGTVHKRLHNMLYADGHVVQKKTAPTGQLIVYIDPETLLMDPAHEEK